MREAEWRLVHFKELPMTRADFEAVHEDSLALFSVSSYAVSELNAIAKVMLATIHVLEKDDAVNAAGFIQSACLLRYWTLKLFEFHECLVQVKKNENKLCSEVVDLVRYLLKEFDELKGDVSYSLARAVRNEATGHYSVFTAKKNLPFVDAGAMASLFIHENAGNSLFPLGEEVMFVGRMNRHGASVKSDEDRSNQMRELFHWNKGANGWVRRSHMSIFRNLIKPYVSAKSVKKRVFWVEPKKVGDVSDFNVPIFAASNLESPA